MTKHEPEIREITRDEFVHKMHSGERFILVDVLPHDHFLRVHLPGAINIPVNLLRDIAPLVLGKHDQVIVYCSNFDCTASPTAAKILMQMGYTDVLDYAGGIVNWAEGGFPLMQGEEHPEEEHTHEEAA